MLNAEKYKEEIMNNCKCKFGFSNRIVKCEFEECPSCLFSNMNNNDSLSCTARKVKWLLSEYKEKIILFELEYVILKFIHKEGFKYIARDKDGNLFAFRFKPKKSGDIWDCDIKRNISYANDLIIFNKLLKFVKWEDTEPRSIEELLKNCEVVDDE